MGQQKAPYNATPGPRGTMGGVTKANSLGSGVGVAELMPVTKGRQNVASGTRPITNGTQAPKGTMGGVVNSKAQGMQ